MKLDYAIRVVTYLAKESPNRTVTVSEISENQKIPAAYLMRIVAELANSKIVNTTRGKYGGLKLGMPSSSISVSTIANSLGFSLNPINCLSDDGKKCEFDSNCSQQNLWSNVSTLLNNYLKGVYISDLVKNDITSPIGSKRDA